MSKEPYYALARLHHGVHTDQQGFEAFLAYKLDQAEKFWQILQREGVTAPDLPEWYR